MTKTPMLPAFAMLPAERWRFLPKDAAAAIVVVDGGKVLMQHRDSIEGILYPGFWGLFGGALEDGEDFIQALKRELYEEASLDVEQAEYFTAIDYDLGFCGKGWIRRHVYVIHIKHTDIPNLKLGEGDDMRVFSFQDILAEIKVVPFDAWALWLYANSKALSE